MNITGRPVTPKGTGNIRSREPNVAEQRHWDKVCRLGCIVGPHGCDYRGLPTTRHHCETGAGGRKDHMKVIPLCWEHHLGKEGVDGKRMSKKAWQQKYGTEQILMTRVLRRLVYLFP